MLSTTRQWSEKFVIKHPWHDVVSSVQIKYPNPYNPNVLNIDVLNRHVDCASGVIRSCKLINSSWPMFNVGYLRALEYSCIQVPEKRMTSKTVNIDLHGVLNGSEIMEYTVHPENKDWTVLEHSISVEAFSLIAMSAISFCRQTAYQGREALNWVISHRLPTIQPSHNNQPGNLIPTKKDEQLNSLYSDATLSLSDSSAQNFDSSFPKSKPVTLSPENISPLYTKSADSSFFTEISRYNPSITKFAKDQSGTDSLGSRLQTFSRDVTAITDALVRRSQRVARLFSRIDEYVVVL
ncbi:unnamed protein product [Heterobilharzia americana]|nr:unnamed protein product [Heterobilharzia americana]